MNISEFAESRGIKPETVRRYLANHIEIRQYTEKKGRSVELLPDAVALLNKIYPFPDPVEVVSGVPKDEYIRMMQKLEESQEKVISLQERLESLLKIQYQIESSEKEIARLEDANRTIEERLKRKGKAEGRERAFEKSHFMGKNNQ